MSDVDRVWLSAHHPSATGDLLHEAAHLGPKDAAGLLLHHMPTHTKAATLADSLDCLGIAVGTLTPTLATKGHARSLWRSTLPVLLITRSPSRKAPSTREIAEQVGYLVYGSAAGESSHRQVREFAEEFEHGLAHV